MLTRYQSILWLVTVFLVLSIAACGGQNSVAVPVTPPAIQVHITKDNCPSIEVQVGMQIVWTNQDDVDRVVIIERANEQGVVVDSGGTDLLRPADTFSTSLSEAGQYIYYCSIDRTAFGTITVFPASYPYP